MGVALSGKYLGNKKIELTHGPSGIKLVTSAPVDNQGDGSSFSPTDLASAALGACLLTIMSIYAERNEIDMSGAWFEAEKNMTATPPRRIASIPVKIHLPARLTQVQRETLERVAQGCPVHRSLSEAVETPIEYLYGVQ